MSFWSDLGNWASNAFGFAQANAASNARNQESNAVNSLQGFGSNAQGAAQGALGYTQGSMGANAADTLQRATSAGMGTAKQIAEQTGNATGRQVGSAARTAGLNKGQAALEAGQAAGGATAAALPQAEQQQIGNYYTGVNQGIGLQGQLGSQALGGYGGAASTAAGMAGTQGGQGQTGAGMLGNVIQGGASAGLGLATGGASGLAAALAKGGVTRGPSLAGEAGPEVVIPVRKILKVAPRPLAEVLKVIGPEIKETTEAGEGESKEPTISDLIKRIEALEGAKAS